MNSPSANVERFYASLAKLTPREWVSLMSHPPADEYQRASEPGRLAIVAFAEAPTDLGASSALLGAQKTAPRMAGELMPDLARLRDDMRPYATAHAGELPPEMYATIRSEISRRVLYAASGLALADHLTPIQLTGLMSPFEALITPSLVLSPPPGIHWAQASMMIPHQAVTRVEPHVGEAPCMFEECQLNATKIAHTTNAPGGRGPVGLAIEVPYCERHLDAVTSGRAEPAQTEQQDRPAHLDTGLLLRVIGVAAGAIALAFLYSPHTPIVWFVIQAVLIVPIFAFPRSPIAALVSGAWLVYFWVPLGAWVLTQFGVLH